jgi:hypothetical protein
MTKLYAKFGKHIIMDRGDHTQAEWTGKCELCGKVGELRPFGPNNESICFECGMKDPKTTEAKMEELMLKGDN